MDNIKTTEAQGEPPYFGWDTCPNCGKVSEPTKSIDLSDEFTHINYVWECECGHGRLVTTAYHPMLDWVVLTNQFLINPEA